MDHIEPEDFDSLEIVASSFTLWFADEVYEGY
jgi:hypothetical protein